MIKKVVKTGTKKTPAKPMTSVYKVAAPSKSYQDSMTAYNKIKGKAAGAESLKPKGAPKTYVKSVPTSSIKIKKK